MLTHLPRSRNWAAVALTWGQYFIWEIQLRQEGNLNVEKVKLSHILRSYSEQELRLSESYGAAKLLRFYCPALVIVSSLPSPECQPTSHRKGRISHPRNRVGIPGDGKAVNSRQTLNHKLREISPSLTNQIPFLPS